MRNWLVTIAWPDGAVIATWYVQAGDILDALYYAARGRPDFSNARISGDATLTITPA